MNPRRIFFLSIIVIAFVEFSPLLFHTQESQGTHRELYRIQWQGRYGYIDTEGHEKIPCRFTFAGNFSNGLAPVRENGLWGYIDTAGRWKIPPVYDVAGEFHFGLASVRTNNTFQLLDTNGRQVMDLGYLDGICVAPKIIWTGGYDNPDGRMSPYRGGEYVTTSGRSIWKGGYFGDIFISWKDGKGLMESEPYTDSIGRIMQIDTFGTRKVLYSWKKKYYQKDLIAMAPQLFRDLPYEENSWGDLAKVGQMLLLQHIVKNPPYVTYLTDGHCGVINIGVASPNENVLFFKSSGRLFPMKERGWIPIHFPSDRLFAQHPSGMYYLLDTSGRVIGKNRFSDVEDYTRYRNLLVKDSATARWGMLEMDGRYQEPPHWDWADAHRSATGAFHVCVYDTVKLRAFLRDSLRKEKGIYLFSGKPLLLNNKTIAEKRIADSLVQDGLARNKDWTKPFAHYSICDSTGRVIFGDYPSTLQVSDADFELVEAENDSVYGYMNHEKKWVWSRPKKERYSSHDTLSPTLPLARNYTVPLTCRCMSGCYKEPTTYPGPAPVPAFLKNFAAGVGIWIDTAKTDTVSGTLMHSVYVYNTGKEPAWARVYETDGLQVILEARTKSGTWLPIQEAAICTPESYCPVELPSQNAWRLEIPLIRGIDPTRFRMLLVRRRPPFGTGYTEDCRHAPGTCMSSASTRVYALDGWPYELIYSNEFSGTINPGVFSQR